MPTDSRPEENPPESLASQNEVHHNFVYKVKKSYDLMIVGIVASILSILATAWSYFNGYILAYGDAESHLDIAKRVIGGLEPGFGQLGGIWLPLHHLLMVPFIWNDFMWRSGLAGGIVSMVAYVVTAVFIFKLAGKITGTRFGAYAATAIFALNPDILYMQTTPMSEMLLICMMVLSIYHLYEWARQENLTNLILAGLFCAAGTLVRYDAWLLVGAETAVVIAVALYRRWRWSRLEGALIMFSAVSFSGIVLWIAWSLVIFHQPAYFLTSQYSAKSQQQGFAARGELVNAHNIGSSLLYYGDAVWENAGGILTTIACIGLVLFIIISLKTKTHRVLVLPALLILVPFIFNVLTLYMGISILFMPRLVPTNFEWHIFNVRYGLMMVPAVAVFAAYALSKLKIEYAPGFVLVLALPLMFLQTPITLQDGLTGLSARKLLPANNYVAANYDYGNIVFDDFSRSANPIALGIPIKNIIYVGYAKAYQQAVDKPSSIVRWIIVRKADTDIYWSAVKSNPDFKKNFQAVYVNGDSVVYRRQDGSTQKAPETKS